MKDSLQSLLTLIFWSIFGEHYISASPAKKKPYFDYPRYSNLFGYSFNAVSCSVESDEDFLAMVYSLYLKRSGEGKAEYDEVKRHAAYEDNGLDPSVSTAFVLPRYLLTPKIFPFGDNSELEYDNIVNRLLNERLRSHRGEEQNYPFEQDEKDEIQTLVNAILDCFIGGSGLSL